MMLKGSLGGLVMKKALSLAVVAGLMTGMFAVNAFAADTKEADKSATKTTKEEKAAKVDKTKEEKKAAKEKSAAEKKAAKQAKSEKPSDKPAK
jgi:hypothetical protein